MKQQGIARAGLLSVFALAIFHRTRVASASFTTPVASKNSNKSSQHDEIRRFVTAADLIKVRKVLLLQSISTFPSSSRLFLASRNKGDDDSDDDAADIDLSDQDWRAFRARLVMGSTKTSVNTSAKDKKATEAPTTNDLDGIGALFPDEQEAAPLKLTPLDPTQWAYDSGTVIEQGAVILGGVEQDFGFGLRQQYFHKAAILVLDHEDHTFTKGIILNRPSDLTLKDDVNKGVTWRVWFGGDVQGLTSDNPEIVCLHTLKNVAVTRASIPVMNDIQWTTFDVAKKLVKAGAAKPTDFWVFCGYAGWGPRQLMGELERKSWYMVATDSQTLLRELARQVADADPRDAGLETWSMLMGMIGKSKISEEHTGGFDDLMIKEWALTNVLSVEAGGGAGRNAEPVTGRVGAVTPAPQSFNPVDRLVLRASTSAAATKGTIVRASPADRSPFLLDGQELHKSLVLIVSDDENMTTGVILNRPGAKGLEVRVQEKGTGISKRLQMPLRYGGQFSVKGSEPLMWLHSNAVLKAAKVGIPIGSAEGIWKCKADDMISAVGQALATPEDFLVVAGVSVWTKNANGLAQGMLGEIQAGRFEAVPESKTHAIWEKLAKQEILTKSNFGRNLMIAGEAWSKGSANDETTTTKKKNGGSVFLPSGGRGEASDKEGDSLVFRSDVKVAKLSDDALRSWVATFLLGAPTLGK